MRLLALPTFGALVLLLIAGAGLGVVVAAGAAVWSPLAAPTSAMMLNAVGPEGEESIVGFTRDKPAFRTLARLARARLPAPEPGVDTLTEMETSIGYGVQISHWHNASNYSTMAKVLASVAGPRPPVDITKLRDRSTHILARAGWPFHSFECEGSFNAFAANAAPTIITYPPNWPSQGGRPAKPPVVLLGIDWVDAVDAPAGLRPARGMRDHLPRPLPYRPLFVGLALNTVFFGAMLLIAGRLLTALVTMRSRRRGRRGLCIGCGYSRAGLGVGAPCPECGHVVKG